MKHLLHIFLYILSLPLLAQSFEELKQEGDDNYNQSKYEIAIAFYSIALDKKPDLEVQKLKLKCEKIQQGIESYYVKEYTQSLEYFEPYLEDNADALYYTAIIKIKQNEGNINELAQAEKDLETAKKSRKKDNIEIEQINVEKKDIERKNQREKNFRVNLREGKKLVANSKYEEGLIRLNKAQKSIDLAHSYHKSQLKKAIKEGEHMIAAIDNYNKKNYLDAKTLFLQYPNNQDANYYLGEIEFQGLVENRNYFKAKKYLQKAVDLGKLEAKTSLDQVNYIIKKREQNKADVLRLKSEAYQLYEARNYPDALEKYYQAINIAHADGNLKDQLNELEEQKTKVRDLVNGINAYKNKYYKQSYKSLKKYSSDNPDAMYYVGKMQFLGKGTYKNRINGKEMIKKAALNEQSEATEFNTIISTKRKHTFPDEFRKVSLGIYLNPGVSRFNKDWIDGMTSTFQEPVESSGKTLAHQYFGSAGLSLRIHPFYLTSLEIEGGYTLLRNYTQYIEGDELYFINYDQESIDTRLFLNFHVFKNIALRGGLYYSAILNAKTNALSYNLLVPNDGYMGSMAGILFGSRSFQVGILYGLSNNKIFNKHNLTNAWQKVWFEDTTNEWIALDIKVYFGSPRKRLF